jgi:endonuclease YncB( thermonuclease family)
MNKQRTLRRPRAARSAFRLAGDALLALVILGVAGAAVLALNGETVGGNGEAARAIDGDSLRLGGREIRLWGIDAPEMRQQCRVGGKDQPCGRDARARLVQLLEAGGVTCNGLGEDRHGRLLAVCRAGRVDINRTLVEEGVAFDYGGYPAEEAAARAQRRGVWAGDVERPRSFRDRTQAGMDLPAGALDWFYQKLQAFIDSGEGRHEAL